MSGREQHLEQFLSTLPERMEFPPTPDIAGRIVASLPERRPSRMRRVSPWALGGVALAAVLLVLLLPGPRRAVADFLDLPGIRIELTDRPSTDEQPTSIGSSLLFGERTTLEDAHEQAPFTVLVPAEEGIPEPDEVWMRTTGDVTAVSLIYAESEDLPEIGETGVGMLLMQFQTTEEVPFLAKRVNLTGMLRNVTVNGQQGYWIEDAELIVLPPGIEYTQGMSRRSGNVLLWEDGSVTYRMETALDMATAMRIAESLQPVDESAGGNQTGRAIVGEVATLRTSPRRYRHEPSSLPHRCPRCTAPHPHSLRPRRRLGVHPAAGAADSGRRR